MPIDEPYVLWSVEHHAWWAPNECGYAETLAGAGIYPKARAFAIVMRANVRSFNECAIPARALLLSVAGDGNQPPSGLRGDPGAPRTVTAPARDTCSATVILTNGYCLTCGRHESQHLGGSSSSSED